MTAVLLASTAAATLAAGAGWTAASRGRSRLRAELARSRSRERATHRRSLTEAAAARDGIARRIAAHLHEDAIQQLGALRLRLGLAAARTGDVVLDELADDAGEIAASLRALLAELHPALLESCGLTTAIEASADVLRKHGIEVEVEPLETRLPVDVELLAYRLVQEILANVLRHAGASRVAVGLASSPRALRCQVSDDGRGFDVTEFGRGADGGRGLLLAREHVALAGGRLFVSSRPGGGTDLVFELPLPSDRPRRPLEVAR